MGSYGVLCGRRIPCTTREGNDPEYDVYDGDRNCDYFPFKRMEITETEMCRLACEQIV